MMLKYPLLLLLLPLFLLSACIQTEEEEAVGPAAYQSSGYQEEKFISLEAGFSLPKPRGLVNVTDVIEEDLVCAWTGRGDVTIRIFMKHWPAAEMLAKLVVTEGRRPEEGYRDWGIGNEQYFEINTQEAYRLSYIMAGPKEKNIYCKESYLQCGPYFVDLQLKVYGDDLKTLAWGTAAYERWLEAAVFFQPQQDASVSEDAREIGKLFQKFESALLAGETEKYLECFHQDYPHFELEEKFIGEKVPRFNYQGSSWSVVRKTLVVNALRASAVYNILRFRPVEKRPADDFQVEFQLCKEDEQWLIVGYK